MDRLAIESITFTNFKALVNTTLPLGPFTLIVGPNGSGKSTALQAIGYLRRGTSHSHEAVWLRSATSEKGSQPQLLVKWSMRNQRLKSLLRWIEGTNVQIENQAPSEPVFAFLNSVRVFSLDPIKIEENVKLMPQMELQTTGAGLAGVLDRLRDDAPERFASLNLELTRWLPEFDQILFETPSPGERQIKLRTSSGGHAIPAKQLSQGTLLAIAMLTLAYLPEPPSLIGLEEPDRGIHPRLLRDVRDALYRLAYPESFGESRPPVQVIATTQSPYFLDLFKEHPEEIVIAEKDGLEAKFSRLQDHPHIEEILADAPLGEVWYSGVLGGVPVSS